MKCVSTHPFDLDEKQFGDSFQQNLLDFAGDEKKKMTDSVVGVLKRITEISNTNIIKNTDPLLTKRPLDSEVEWFGKNRFRIPENKLKVFYQFLHWIVGQLKFGQ